MRTLFIALICGWVVALPGATLLSKAPPSVPAAVLVQAVYTCGRAVCHQRPERSFVLAGAPLPVCARCTGLYIGAAVAAIVLSARRRSIASQRPTASAGSASGTRLVLSVAAVPILVTLVVEWTTGHVPAGVVRASSAAPLGAAIAWTVLRATRSSVKSE